MVLRSLKVAALRAAKTAGLFSVARRSAWRQRRLLILCYHGTSLLDEHLWSNLYVTEAHLRARFTLLRAYGCNVLPLNVALDSLYSGTLPPRSVALTFDDGTHDFYAKAYPVLREFGYSATLYLSTFYCFFQRPVFDPLSSYLLWKGRGLRVDLGGVAEGSSTLIPECAADRAKLHQRMRTYASANMSAGEKDEFAQRLAVQVGEDFDTILAQRLLHLMTPAEVAHLDPAVVDVQLHTHRHRTPRDEALLTRELTDNREAIQRILPAKSDLRHFCYPSGDYSREFLPWLRRAGIASATTCETQIATPNSDPLLLPRLIDTMETPTIVLESWLSGVAAFLLRRRRAVE